jgi:hypothetical protein
MKRAKLFGDVIGQHLTDGKLLSHAAVKCRFCAYLNILNDFNENFVLEPTKYNQSEIQFEFMLRKGTDAGSE